MLFLQFKLSIKFTTAKQYQKLIIVKMNNSRQQIYGQNQKFFYRNRDITINSKIETLLNFQLSPMLKRNVLKNNNQRSSSYVIRRNNDKTYILSKSVNVKDQSKKTNYKLNEEKIKILDRHKESEKQRYYEESGQKSLLQKINEIESINNFRKNKSMMKKNVSKLVKKYAKNTWDSFLISGNVSNSTYGIINESIKKRIQHLDSSIFMNSVIQSNSDKKRDEVQLLSKQAPLQLLNFVSGFPDYCRKEQIESLNKDTNLWILKNKISNSQGLNKLYKALLEDRYYKELKQEDLSNNFISAVHALQFISRNGSIDDKSKQILQLSFCTL